QLAREGGALADQHQHLGIAQAHGQLADALDRAREDLGVQRFQLGRAAQLAHGILAGVEDDDFHDARECAVGCRSFRPGWLPSVSLKGDHPMATISMHAASVPVFAKMLGNMLNWIEAAKAHAEAKKFSTDV